MKIPEKVYVRRHANFEYDDGYEKCSKRKSLNNVEYIRADIAEKMAKEFHTWIRTQLYQECEFEATCDILTYFNPFDPDVTIYTIDELFTEFINSRNK